MMRFGLILAVSLLALPLAGAAQTPSPAVSGAAQTTPPPAAAGSQHTTPPPAVAGSQQAAPPPAVAGSQQAAPPPAQDSAVTQYTGPIDADRYVIGPQDSLQVTVWKEPTLSGTFPVRPDGMISLVLVGDLPAAGRTPMALSTDVTQKLKKYIQDPVVTVVVQGVNSQRIFMVGEVNHVGPVMLTPGMTPLQAIVTAGGLTQFASTKHIYILRTVAGKQQKIPFNYKEALKGNDQGSPMQPGDTIVVR